MKYTRKYNDIRNKVPRRDRLRKLLSGFLAVSTAITMLGGNATVLSADEAATEYALAGAGSGEDVTIHFGDADDQTIKIHVNPETGTEEEASALAGLGFEAGDETETEAGQEKVEAGDLVTISSVDGSLLPDEAEASAEIVTGRAEDKAVEKVEAVADSGPSIEAADSAASAEPAAKTEEEATEEPANSGKAPVPEPAIAEKTEYQVFEISLDNVDEEQYQDGFKVEVTLPEEVIGRDFKLYHIHNGEEPVEIPVDTVGSVDRETGLEAVSGFEFVTEGFSKFVLKYTVDFYWEAGGQVYRYSIDGESSVALSALIESLRVNTGDLTTAQFMEQIESVVFSDASLIEVVREGDDWILYSLASFTTDESLTITMQDGQVFTILVTDPPAGSSNESSNLGDFLTKVTVSGASVIDGQYVVQEGQTYTVTMSFKESKSVQFDNDAILTYHLPSGIVLPQDQTKTISIAIVSGRITYEVPATVRAYADGTITVEFDKTNENYYLLEDATNVGLRISVDARFTEAVSSEGWGKKVERDIVLDTTDNSDAYVTKTAVFDEKTGKFTYTIKVTASGTPMNVNVKDVITGEALIFNNDVIVTGNSSSFTPNTVEKGFDYTFASMQNGEVITITYTASVDLSKASNGIITADQTRNIVTSQKEGGEPHNAEYSHGIELVSLDKSNGSESGTTSDGKKLYSWTIDYNPMAKLSVKGDTIKDTIESASQAYMTYHGDVTVKVYDSSGIQVATRTFTPDTTSWSYTIPEEDTAAYHYVFEYQTIVDQIKVDQSGQAILLKNDVSGGERTDSGGIIVNPTEETTITKAVESSNSTEVRWVSTVHVPKSGLSSAVVTDILPNIYRGNIGLDGYENVYDAYKNGSLEITGLLSGESYDVSTSDKEVVITFYKDEGKSQQGLQGTSTAGGRDITIKLTTLVNQDWLQYGYNHPGDYRSTHTNEIRINGKSAQALVTFAPPSLEKKGEKLDSTHFMYTLVLSGDITAPISIEDTFDTSLLQVATDLAATWNYFKIFGGDQYSQYSGKSSVNYSDTENGILITADDVPRQANGEYYPYYRITYFLKLKDGVNLEDLAVENGGSYDLTNTATWGGHTTSYTYTTIYDFLDKKLLKEATSTDRQVQYQITFNPAKAELNGGQKITMTDTLNEHLSIDYTSISITTDPEDAEVSYVLQGVDGGGTLATYTIPDSTKVVITYNAMVVGNGIIHYTNVVEANGQTETVEKTTEVNIEGEGEGAVADLKVVKLDGYDASKKLAGVQFKLYSADLTDSGSRYDLSLDNSGVYEMILTTDKDGVLAIDGKKMKIIIGVKYYLEEIAAPDGYQKLSFPYQFTLEDSMDEVNYGQYIYFYNDSFQIKNWPLEGLVIEKYVDSSASSDYTKSFTFEVSILTEGGAVDTNVNKTYGNMRFVNGIATVYLKDGEQASAWDMPPGTKFKVEEKDADGYIVSTTVGETTTEGSSYTGTTSTNYTKVSFTNKKNSVDLSIVKVNGADRTTPLSGAGFTLWQLQKTGKGTHTGDDPVVSALTDNEGKTSFSELSDGYYEIVETTVPTGYIITDSGSFFIHVHDRSITLLTKDTNKVVTDWEEYNPGEGDSIQVENTTVTIGNPPGAVLPATGGTGTRWIYLIGVLLIALAGAGFILVRRRRELL